MNIDVRPGKYLIAVSGGVDSVVLLDLLQTASDVECIVAHFDHGIRPDSAQDAQFVQGLANEYGCTFVTERAELGPNASEASARAARYAFLERAALKEGAVAIFTAHHQDDVLETAIFNLLRGTGRRGLASLRSTDELQRPLLGYPKQQLLAYATEQNLSWQEDITNHDERYSRNYIRRRLLVRFDAGSRQQLLTLITGTAGVNDELDDLLAQLLPEPGSDLNRHWFCSLPYIEAREVLAYWLRGHGLRDYDAHGLDRLTVQLKVRAPGSVLDVKHGFSVHLKSDFIAFKI